MAGKSHCRFTNEQIQESLKKYVTKKKAAEALGVNVTSFNRWVKNGVPTGDKLARRVREGATERGGLGGFSLKGLRTASKKPQNSTRALLYTLDKDKGYVVDDLCREWCVQPETLIKHAKSVGAFVYAEISRENWVPVITYPKS